MKIAIIGAGPAGYVAALKAAKLGMSVTLVEKAQLGGTCLNRGCIPTKSLLQAASVYNTIKKESAEWGITVPDVSVDFNGVYAKKAAIVEQLQKGIAMLLNNAGVEVISGTAKVLPNKIVRVEETETEIKADKILICTGSQTARLPIEGIEFALSSDDVLARPVEAEKVAIIGGGVIGVEFAQMLARFGCEVCIYEFQSALVAMMDTDVSKQLAMQLKKLGVKLQLQAAVSKITPKDGGFEVEASVKEKPHTAHYDKVIACVGRKPFRDGVLADGVEPDDDIKFAGDAAGGIQLAHYASAQAVNIIEEWAGVRQSNDLSLVPQCIYTSPEAASVGKREQDCTPDEIKIGMYRINGNGKALIMGENSGFVKTIFSAETGRLIGAHIVAPHATDIIGEMAIAISKGLTADEIGSVIHAHPTVSESICESIIQITN